MSSISSCQVSQFRLIVEAALKVGNVDFLGLCSCFFSTSDLFAFWLGCPSYLVSLGFHLVGCELQRFEEGISSSFVVKMSNYFGGLLVRSCLQGGLESGLFYEGGVSQYL